jgi:protein O-GlcNAc transferase
MNEKIIELQNLFIKKEYSKLIFLIENTIEEQDKSGQILNFLGAAKMLKGPKNKTTIKSAIINFKESYLKLNEHNSCLDSLVNLINSSCDFFDLLDSTEDFSNNFNELINFFNKAKAMFGSNEKLTLSMVRVYKRLNDLDNTLLLLNNLVEENFLSLNSLPQLIFNNNFKNDWSQKDFYHYSKLLQKFVPDYPKEKLSTLGKNNNVKIKIGFLSSDIKKKHSITYFLKTVLSNYDKERYELILILNHSKNDDDTNQFIKLVDGVVNIHRLNDIGAINLIRNLKFDVIFDIMGLTSSYRIALFKNRIAPIQISWLGYCNTMGLENMDYIFSDSNLIYNDEKKFYSEKIVFLKDIWNCHSGFHLERKRNMSPFIKNKFITFGSFNNFSKINDDVINIWAQILKNVPNSKLILKSNLKKDCSRIKKIFKKNKVDENILFYEKTYPVENHLKLYENIDIALDTFPYNGVTTSFEAIWMGVPVLTMKGYNFNSRCGESINKNLKLDCLIANSSEEYISKAKELAQNTTKLIEIRDHIFFNAIESPLFDQSNFSKNFFSSIENVYNNI